MARDTSFYYSFLVLPADKRRAIVAVWDFCRAVDDAVDEAPAEQSASEVQRWRDEVARCFDGGHAGDPAGRALQPLIAGFDLPRSAFEALVEGVEMDLHGRRYRTFDELYEYCIRVASAVGLMCVRDLRLHRIRRRASTRSICGVALQLTNILRDVPGDLARGRVLPADRRSRALRGDGNGSAGRDRARGGVRSPEGESAARVRGRARAAITRVRTQRCRASDARRLVAARIMGNIYRGILDRIERAGYDVFTAVIRVPRPRRALIAATTWAKTLVTGR